MKKLLVLFFTTCATLWASAQTDPCNCVETRTQHKIERFCPAVAGPEGAYIAITYTEISCGGRVRYRVDNFHVATSEFNTGTPVNCLIVGLTNYPSTNPYTNFGNPSVTEDWFNWMQRTIAALMPQGNSTADRVIQYPSGCKSLVPVKYPPGTVIYVAPPDSGGSALIPVDLSDKVSLTLMNCNPVECCVAEINNDNGEITYIPVVANACANATLDYSTLPQITTALPSGGTQTYFATIVGTPPPCQSMCSYNAPTSFMATDVSPINAPLNVQFAATPTLVQDAITFTTEVDITKVQVYDMQGKKVLDTPIENKQLLVSQLKEGVYFVQVHFANKEVRTVKIYKK
jgi:hypothetical protein